MGEARHDAYNRTLFPYRSQPARNNHQLSIDPNNHNNNNNRKHWSEEEGMADMICDSWVRRVQGGLGARRREGTACFTWLAEGDQIKLQ